MILQSYTIFSARNSSTTLFLHHSWRIGTNTNYRWGFFAAMGCPSSPGAEHSQRVWESQVWQRNRALCSGHSFLLSAFSTEHLRLSGNPYLGQLQACQYHTAECDIKLMGTQKHISKNIITLLLDSARLIWSTVCEYHAQRQRDPSRAYLL